MPIMKNPNPSLNRMPSEAVASSVYPHRVRRRDRPTVSLRSASSQPDQSATPAYKPFKSRNIPKGSPAVRTSKILEGQTSRFTESRSGNEIVSDVPTTILKTRGKSGDELGNEVDSVAGRICLLQRTNDSSVPVNPTAECTRHTSFIGKGHSKHFNPEAYAQTIIKASRWRRSLKEVAGHVMSATAVYESDDKCSDSWARQGPEGPSQILTLTDLAYGSQSSEEDAGEEVRRTPPYGPSTGGSSPCVVEVVEVNIEASPASPGNNTPTARPAVIFDPPPSAKSRSLESGNTAMSLRDASPLRERSVQPCAGKSNRVYHVMEARRIHDFICRVNFSFYQ